jgi:Golgi phosphoprotein 3 (GPP34)
MQNDSARRRFPLADRLIEVVDDTLTGEVLLDEALKMMKSSEKMSVSSWIDLMSGKNTSIYTVMTLTHNRRDMEPHEDRLSAQTGPRAPG